MLKKHQGFNFVFALVFIIQLITESDTLTHLFLIPNIHYFVKPLITISLFTLLLYHTGLRGRFSKRIGAGLLFGLAGDVFLLFEDQNESFFIFGLVAFLLGHIAYMSAFYLDYRVNKTVYQKYTKHAMIGFGLFSVVFCALLWSYLGDLRFPVIIYALAISLMGIMAVNRFGRVNSLSFKLIFYGSLLFILSDSVLAINRFVYEFKVSGIIVMATYMAAQYLITMGNIERKMKKKVEEI
ncbi:lysoplasmalogenase [Pedobacter sp. Du54]|uniref:lysoplasmalogenase n=1 Tax=Pedobacter anseongensis TaxID=3133439 RepID=UPI0030A2D793